ncbi:MAG: diguanylate cyclase [Sedimenticola sp.]|nr:diguanylate cyclase [Sedimenticola sp.]
MEQEARLPADSPWIWLSALSRGRRAGHVVMQLASLLLYLMLGFFSLHLGQGYSGLPGIWLPSGIALFLVLAGGYRLAVGPFLGMLVLALYQQMPLAVALAAALGATLEALLPTLLLRRLKFDPRLQRIRDVMLFVLFAVLIGPLFSAVPGTLAGYYTALEMSVRPLDHASLWWLANSVGCLVVGGLLLVWATASRISLTLKCRLFLTALLSGVALASMLSVLQLSVGQPTLLLFLVVPLIVFAAVYCGQQGATLISLGAALATLVTMYEVPQAVYAPHMVGHFSIDVALIWVAAFTGLVVASAYSEQGARAMYADLARHDGLTRLINRHAFEERLERAIQSARQSGKAQSHALMFIDLDDFKLINDRYGHAAGDRVLRELAALLQMQVRSRDTVARLGGDEFVVLLEYCDADCAGQMAERIAEAVRGLQLPVSGARCQVTVSIGVVPVGSEAGEVEQVLAAADAAHYRAKQEGKNQVCHCLLGPALEEC